MTKETIWDAHPTVRRYGTKDIEFFTRSALAKALNRQLDTIRSMERKGVICHPRLKDNRGWWLYTRSQIEAMVELAEEENVLYPRFRAPFSQRFINEAHNILNRTPS